MMKKVRLLLGVFSLLFAALLCANTIYKTVKPDGTIVFSDVPSPGSVEVDIVQDKNVVIPSLASPQVQQNVNKKTQILRQQYQIAILSPAPNETIRNNLGEVNIRFEIQPDFVGRIYLLLDNQLVNTGGKKQLKLNNVERGTHSIEVQLRDNSGKIFASSGQQTFFLHKASALINAN